MKVKIHNIILHTKVLGPETRTAIWFQGCNKNCKGCMSQSTRNINGGKTVDVDKLCESFLKLDDIEGITLSGGEVFLQIDALHDLLKIVRAQSDLGVIIYTGFYIDELRKMDNPKVNEILDGLADIIIDGPYIEELNDGKSLKGSSNQNVNFTQSTAISTMLRVEMLSYMLMRRTCFSLGFLIRKLWNHGIRFRIN